MDAEKESVNVTEPFLVIRFRLLIEDPLDVQDGAKPAECIYCKLFQKMSLEEGFGCSRSIGDGGPEARVFQEPHNLESTTSFSFEKVITSVAENVLRYAVVSSPGDVEWRDTSLRPVLELDSLRDWTQSYGSLDFHRIMFANFSILTHIAISLYGEFGVFILTFTAYSTYLDDMSGTRILGSILLISRNASMIEGQLRSNFIVSVPLSKNPFPLKPPLKNSEYAITSPFGTLNSLAAPAGHDGRSSPPAGDRRRTDRELCPPQSRLCRGSKCWER
jgi:hypothetical protein